MGAVHQSLSTSCHLLRGSLKPNTVREGKPLQGYSPSLEECQQDPKTCLFQCKSPELDGAMQLA